MLDEHIRSAFDTVCNNIAWSRTHEFRFAVWIPNEGEASCRMGGFTEDLTYAVTRDTYYICLLSRICGSVSAREGRRGCV